MPDDAALIRGFLVNKFRGDPALFADGMALIAAATGWQALGLVPFFPEARLLPAEDALALDGAAAGQAGRAASRSPCRSCRISPISTISIRSTPSPTVDLVRVRPGSALPGDADLVILPGSKATIADLAALRARGLGHRHRRASAPRRRGARPLRRLSDARPRDRRSRRHRRAARHGGRARPARCRDHADGGEAARAGRMARPSTARRSPATRCIWA